jgi:hypothetical protein
MADEVALQSLPLGNSSAYKRDCFAEQLGLPRSPD